MTEYIPISQFSSAGTGALPQYPAERNGFALDGSTNDQPALAALVAVIGANYVATGRPGAIVLPAGAVCSIQNKGTVWQSGVGIVCGPGAKFVLSNAGDTTNPTPLATFTVANNGASISNFLADCWFVNVEIDGSAVTLPGGYNVGAKGFGLQFMLRGRFLNCYVHGCAASGFGVDYLDDTIMTNCLAIGNGRLNNGTQLGGAGFGIGVGGWGTAERLTFSNNIARNNGTHGAFFELQNHAWTPPKGIRVSNFHGEGNRYGFSDWGADSLQFEGGFLINNKLDGYYVSAEGTGTTAGINGFINGTVIDGNGRDGVLIGDSGLCGYSIRPRRCTNNARYGVHLNNQSVGGASLANVDLICSDISGNALDGIQIDAPCPDMSLINVRSRNNGQQTAGSDSNSGGTVTYSATGMIDTAKAWGVNTQAGKTLTVGAVTGVVQTNTATAVVLTAAGWSGATPSAAAAYTLPAAPTVRAGLTVNAAAGHPNMRSCRFYDNQSTKTQTHGWQITGTGTWTSGATAGNDLVGNLTGAFLFTTAPSGGYAADNEGLSLGQWASTSNYAIDGAVVITGSIKLSNLNSLWFSTGGPPSAGTGANGDIAFNASGGAATTMYQRRAGAWVATGA